MSGLTDELRPTTPVGTLAAAFVALVALGVVLVLGIVSPEVLVAGAILVFVAWALDRFGSLGGESTSSLADDETALDRLRRRYADGELSDAEFERRLDRLLETETLEDAKRRKDRVRERER